MTQKLRKAQSMGECLNIILIPFVKNRKTILYVNSVFSAVFIAAIR